MLTAGQVHDLAGADTLVPGMEAEALLADKAYDADKRVIEPLEAAGKTAVIPPKKNRKSPRTVTPKHPWVSPIGNSGILFSCQPLMLIACGA